jgi:hypothetical protein
MVEFGMENKKEREMKGIESMVKERMNEKQRIWMLGKVSSGIVARLAKQLIKNIGYSQVVKIIERELKESGTNDAKKIMEMFDMDKADPKNASKVLKIAAVILGMNLDVKGNETVITECPYGDVVKEFPYNQALYCNICREYCKGLIEGVIGDNFEFSQISSMSEGNSCCAFRTQVKGKD